MNGIDRNLRLMTTSCQATFAGPGGFQGYCQGRCGWAGLDQWGCDRPAHWGYNANLRRQS